MPAGDNRLVERVRDGDQEAFRELYDRHEAAVFRFLMSLTRDRIRAQDLYQETWLRVARAIGRKKIDNFKSWIFTIAINIYRDELRKKKSRQFFLGHSTVETDYVHENIETRIVVPASRPRDGDFEIREAIDAALPTLSDKQREVFILCYIQGFKISEVSEVLKMAEGTVKATLFRAVRILRRELAEFRERNIDEVKK